MFFMVCRILVGGTLLRVAAVLHLVNYPVRLIRYVLPHVLDAGHVRNGVARLKVNGGLVLVRVPPTAFPPFPYIEVRGLVTRPESAEKWIPLRAPMAQLWCGTLQDPALLKDFFGVSRLVCIDLSLNHTELGVEAEVLPSPIPENI
jgi:hypothetical protein